MNARRPLIAATRAGALVLAAPPRSPEVRELLRAAKRRLGVDTAVHLVVDGRVWLPRALGHDVKVTSDVTTLAPLPKFIHQVKLWPHQKAGLAALKKSSGVVVMPCGSGKTTLGVAAIAQWAQRTLVVVHTKDLQAQWVQRLQQELPEVSVGVGMTSTAQVVICTVQQLARQTPTALARWGRGFGTLLADEAHRAGATSWQRVVASVPARNRLALTATPEREDGRWPVVEAHFGPVVHRVEEAELVDAGRVMLPSVRCVVSRRAYTDGPVESDGRRDSQIVHIARRLVTNEQRTVVVLVRLVDHAHRLAARLAQWVPAAAMTGDLASTERARILRELRAKRLRVVVATSLFDEAVDVPSVDTVVLGTPTAVLARVQQRIGRSTRVSKGKLEPLVVDICDASHEAEALAREEWYRSRGYSVRVVA